MTASGSQFLLCTAPECFHDTVTIPGGAVAKAPECDFTSGCYGRHTDSLQLSENCLQ